MHTTANPCCYAARFFTLSILPVFTKRISLGFYLQEKGIVYGCLTPIINPTVMHMTNNKSCNS